MNQAEISTINPFEILVGDPSHFKWVAVPEKRKDERGIAPSPFVGVDAGFENALRHRATFISQTLIENSWQPGKAHSGDPYTFAGYDKKEWKGNSFRVLAWAD